MPVTETETCELAIYGASGDCIAGPNKTPAPVDPKCPWHRCAFHCQFFHADGHPEHAKPPRLAHANGSP